MTTPESLARLAAELDTIGRRLQAVGQELQLQRQFVSHPVPPQFAPPPPPAVPEPAPVYIPTLPPPPPSEMNPQGAGSRMLAWLGGSVTLLGIVLLLVLAVQRGWLGPEPRVLAGGALGLALTAAGLWTHRTPAGRSGAFALVATGVAVLYLDLAAATSLYGLLAQWAGLALALVVAGGGLLLAGRWDSQVLAIWVVVCCAICDPMITESFSTLLVSFLIVLQLGAIPAQLMRGWPPLALVAGIPPAIGTVLAMLTAQSDGRLPIGWLSLVVTVIGTGVAVLMTLRGQRIPVAPVLLASSAATPLLTALLLSRHDATVVTLIVAALMLVVALADRWLSLPLTITAATTGTVALVYATVTAFSGPTIGLTLLGEALVLALAAEVTRHRAALLAALLASVAGFVLGLNEISPFALFRYWPDRAWTVTDVFAGLLMTLVAVALPLVAMRIGVIRSAAAQAAPWVLAGIAALYGAAGTVLSTAMLVEPGRTGFLFGHAVITVSWTAAAIVVLLWGVRSAALRASGLVLVGAAVVKLVLFDLATLDGMARVAAFLVAGLLLLLAGTRYARLVSGGGVITDESQGVTKKVPD